ncbi:Aldehyde oxidase and xanthine dehydrogenase, a/b hammerhead domain protein, partial [mine drainage metagenome]
MAVPERPLRLIGTRIPYIDGPLKVSGRAEYTDDIRRPGMLVGRILRSPWAHARILSIDTSEARAIPGV